MEAKNIQLLPHEIVGITEILTLLDVGKRNLQRIINGAMERGTKGIPYALNLRAGLLVPDTPTKEELDQKLAEKADAAHPHVHIHETRLAKEAKQNGNRRR